MAGCLGVGNPRQCVIFTSNPVAGFHLNRLWNDRRAFRFLGGEG
jgi:hypothetical protein